jgi:hypothetical protein
MPLLVTDPIDWKLDPVTHDLVITDDLAWISGVDAVAQGCKIVVGMIEGEWFADLDEGVPYLERDGVTAARALLGQKFNPEKARAAMRPELLSVPGVTNINYLNPSFDRKTRTMKVDFEVDTEFEDTVADSLNRTI